MPTTFNDAQAARALVEILGTTPWEPVVIAKGYIALLEGKTEEEAARIIKDQNQHTLRKSRELIAELKTKPFLGCLRLREKIGSAENPITKLFPGAITERRFVEFLDHLCESRKGLAYNDDREAGHSLTDFTLTEGAERLPINIKNAGTRFLNAKSLVGLDPDDCLPIPAYKAHAAIEKLPSLLYVISVDYLLAEKLGGLNEVFRGNELIVWELLNKYHGSQLKKAEDLFVSKMTAQYWDRFSEMAASNPFHVISARRAIRILQQKPERTPGIGLKAWGTGASGEVNVHISIQAETTDWTVVSERVKQKGVADIIKAVNRTRQETVFDPEI